MYLTKVTDEYTRPEGAIFRCGRRLKSRNFFSGGHITQATAGAAWRRARQMQDLLWGFRILQIRNHTLDITDGDSRPVVAKYRHPMLLIRLIVIVSLNIIETAEMIT